MTQGGTNWKVKPLVYVGRDEIVKILNNTCLGSVTTIKCQDNLDRRANELV